MRMHTRLLVAGLAFLTATCSPESITPVDEGRPTQHLTGPFVVSGTVTVPGGASLCTLVTAQASVRLILPGGSSWQTAICSTANPTNSYTLPAVGAGTYFLQIGIGPTATALPWRYLDPTPVVLDADRVRDVQVQYGSPLGGGATLDGGAVAGVSLNVLYNPVLSYAATSIASSAGGGWDEPAVGRNPPVLQNGLSYLFSGCDVVLAAGLAAPLPSVPVLFPTAVNAINCDFLTNTASERTHFSNRLAVTADAGEFGAQAPVQVAARGRGWGVQFPVGASGPQHLPATATQLVRGGLVFGFYPDKVLSVGEIYPPCGAACQDFGVGTAPAVTAGSPGKIIQYRYSDANMPESERLQVTQWSYDGTGDYVLFHFVIRNTSTTTKTFWAGTFMDWDLDQDASDDGIETDFGGRLMYGYSGMTFLSHVPSGNHLGSMLLGQPVSGNYAWGTFSFYCPGTDPAPGLQVAALSGALVATSQTTATCDKRYLHGAGPITLPPGHQTDLWVPIVAGTDKNELLAAATAAETWWQQNGQRATVTIDIHPGSTSNPINTRSSGVIPVAILGSAGFDVTTADVTTLVFGPGGAVEVHDLGTPKVLAGHLQDVNGDGYTDLFLHFRQYDTGLTAGATQACLNGVTQDGSVFDGCDVVNVK
jgi:hypothetical protein